MNILFIHETEYIEKMIFEYQIIPEILASRGHKVYVIDFPTNWLNEKKSSFFTEPETFENISRANKHQPITLIRPAFIRLAGLSRLTAFFSYFSLIENTIVTYDIDIVVLLAAPTNGLQTLWAARKHRIPVYFRLLDVLHQLVPNKLLRWPTYLIEKAVYRQVDAMSAITPRLRDYAVKMGANAKTCNYIPSGSDADLFFYKDKSLDLMVKHKIRCSDLVLLFAGTLYNFSGLDKVISQFPRYSKKYPHLKLLIIGAGEQETALKALVSRENLAESVIFTGFVNYPELPDYINLADICINPFEINKTTNIIFPGKIYQYLACEKPVIATKLQGMLDIFPAGDISSDIYYYDTIEEFFDLVFQIKRHRIKDPNPSLQEITSNIEMELKELCAANFARYGVVS